MTKVQFAKDLQVLSFGSTSSIAEVTPQPAELIVRLSRIRQCGTAIQCLLLANDLIKCTEYENKVIELKKHSMKRKQILKNIIDRDSKNRNTYLHLKEVKNLHLIDQLH